MPDLIAYWPGSAAAVSRYGVPTERPGSVAAVGLDGVRIFENDLRTFDGSPKDVRFLTENFGQMARPLARSTQGRDRGDEPDRRVLVARVKEVRRLAGKNRRGKE